MCVQSRGRFVAGPVSETDLLFFDLTKTRGYLTVIIEQQEPFLYERTEQCPWIDSDQNQVN